MSNFDFDKFLPKSWLEDGLSLRQELATAFDKVVTTLRKGAHRKAPIAISTSVLGVQLAFAMPSTMQSSGQLQLFDSHPADFVVYSGGEAEVVPEEYWPLLMAKIAAMPKLSDANDDEEIPPYL